MRTAIAGLAMASALVFVSAFASVVRADPLALSSPAPPASPASPAPSASVGASASSSRPEATDARAQIEASLAQMRATSLRVRDQLRVTRRRGTKQQITCVDEALSRSDVALRRAREAGDEALAAYARGDVLAARAARVRLAEIKEAQRLAAADGSSCAARPANTIALLAQPGVTTVKLEVDPRLPPGP